jgi:hypothetical protein
MQGFPYRRIFCAFVATMTAVQTRSGDCLREFLEIYWTVQFAFLKERLPSMELETVQLDHSDSSSHLDYFDLLDYAS